MSGWERRSAARPRRRGLGCAATGLALVVAFAPPARADSGPDSCACTGMAIRKVSILPGPVFEPGSDGGLSGLERFANRLHVRTRAGTIRRQLLFGRGDPWSEAVALESARNLRALGFLDLKSMAARRDGDSIHVSVETRDLWRTGLRLNLASAEGGGVGSIGVTEGNLLGLGKSVAVVYRDDENGTSWNLGYDDPNLGGGPLNLHYNAGKGSEGATDQVAVELPFKAVHTPSAWLTGWNRTTQIVHLFSHAEEAANFDYRVERVDLQYGARLAGGHVRAPDASVEPVQRVIGSFEVYDRRFGESRLEPGSPPAFAGGEENIRIRRLAVELIAWDPDFVERRNIDRIGRVEDFDLGLRFALKVGFAPLAFGSTQDEGYVRLKLDVGAASRLGFGFVRTEASSRLVPEATERLFQIDARWYAPWLPGHTLALGALGLAGVEAPRDFQARAGGLNGLRAFPINSVAGERLWRLNAEERWLFTPESWRLARLGSAVFFDAARAWGAGAEGTGWFRDAGLGLRLGVPAWGLTQVVRIDVAWPIEPSRDGGHAPVWTIGSSQAF